MSERVVSGRPIANDDEIDLREIWRVLVSSKRLILSSMFVAGVIAASVTLMMPNSYRAEVLLAPSGGDSAKGGGMAAALGGLGGLASLAGISLPSSGSTEENIAVLKSREFLWKFVQDNKLMPILFEDEWDAHQQKWKENNPEKQPGQMDVYRLFNEHGLLSVSKDKKTELITVAIEWTDKKAVADWANKLVSRLNQYLAQLTIERCQTNLKYLNEELKKTPVEEMRKTLFDLIATEQKKAMLANTQKEFAFRVLDPAIEPDKKSKPKRTLTVLLATMAAFICALLYVFLKESLVKRRERKAEGPS